MQVTKKQQKILDKLVIGSKDEIITNPYSGIQCILCPTAVALYDFIKGAEILGNYKEFDQARYLFMENWPNEYSKLLD
ncbi:hypothetical protein M0Q50_06600 [bacterium]|nr:hypothetical protein [bacterium]